MHKKKTLLIALVIILGIAGVLLFSFKRADAPAPALKTPEKLTVVATFYPLAEFARGVAGERAEVEMIVPGGAEPHEYEPSPRDVIRASTADIFLLNGAGIDPWAEKLQPELERRGVRMVKMSDRIPLLADTHEEEAHEEGEESEAEPGHSEETASDPHFWLDPELAKIQVESIRQALGDLDPEGRETYAQNAERSLGELEKLDREYREGLAACRLDTIVTSHNAFGYLAKRYGFAVLPLAGLSPEAEPSPGRMAEIAEAIREKKIAYIFFETLVTSRVAETLAREVGATTLVFNPLEGLTEQEARAGKDYLSVMRENLANLTLALGCS